jgi:Tol biopolymer transport system component
MKYFIAAILVISLLGCEGKNKSQTKLNEKKTDSTKTTAVIIKQNTKEKIVTSENGNYSFPHFSPDGQKVYYTSSGQRGIYSYDISSKKTNVITDDQGAGYKFIIIQNGSQIIYRRDSFKSARRQSEIVSISPNGSIQKIIFGPDKNLSFPTKIDENIFMFSANGKLRIYDFSASKFIEPSELKDPILYTDGNSYKLLYNGNIKEFAPLGKGTYIWGALSPNKERVIFNYAGEGAFITDLNGKIISRFGQAAYPQWSPDGNYITYMTEENDGEKIIRADVFISSADAKRSFQITSSADTVELYPSWAQDGKSLVYCTDKGDIYISSLHYETRPM